MTEMDAPEPMQHIQFELFVDDDRLDFITLVKQATFVGHCLRSYSNRGKNSILRHQIGWLRTAFNFLMNAFRLAKFPHFDDAKRSTEFAMGASPICKAWHRHVVEWHLNAQDKFC